MDDEQTGGGQAEAAERAAPSGVPARPGGPVWQGTCYALFAYDVGLAIDLAQAQGRVALGKRRDSIRRGHRAPYYFEYQPAPLRVRQAIRPIAVGQFTTTAAAEAVIYDFGAVSVTYAVPLRGPARQLLGLSDELWDHPQLLADSRRLVEELLRSILPAVTRPGVSELVEDYAIYQIELPEAAGGLEAVVGQSAALLAQTLRAEPAPLSAQEIEDALACQISYGPRDRAIIDWNAALLFARQADDVRAVLEFANVELLELRYLDDRLDDALDQAYEAMSHRSFLRRVVPGYKAADLQRIAALQMDSALLYEGVNNALKLLGDQYLARVYRLASQRFHFDDWNASILRKLQTLESIYQKIADRQANWRMEVLEWIIIVLIAISILLTLLPGPPGR